MKTGNVIFCVLAVLVVLFGLVREPGQAQSQSMSFGQIGVVCISRVLKSRAQSSAWEDKRKAEEKKIEEDLTNLQREIRRAKEDMETREPGSADFQRLGLEWMEKQAVYEARKEFYKRDLSVKEDRWSNEEQEWARGLYKEALKAIEQVAKTRGIEIVAATEEFPSPSAILYHSEGLDITEEVIRVLDEQE